MEKNVRSDLRRTSTREGVQSDSEIGSVVRVGNGGTDEKRQEAEMVELKMLLFSLGVTKIMDKIRSTSEGQQRWDGLEGKHERQDSGGMVMYGGKTMGVLG